MNKDHIVKSTRDFTNIINNGRYVKNKCLVLYFMPNKEDKYRVGVTASKKLGNAVVRNKIKRQLRNIVHKYKKSYQNGWDYIIIVRNSYIDCSFKEIECYFCELVNKINNTFLRENTDEKK